MSTKRKTEDISELLEQIDDEERAKTLYVILHDILRLKDKPKKKSFEAATAIFSGLYPLKHEPDREAAYKKLKEMTSGNIRMWHNEDNIKRTEVRIQSYEKFEQGYIKLYEKKGDKALESITLVESAGGDGVLFVVVNEMWGKAFRPQGGKLWFNLHEIAKFKSIATEQAQGVYAYFNHDTRNPIYKRFRLPPLNFIQQQDNDLALRKESGVKLRVISKATFEQKIKS